MCSLPVFFPVTFPFSLNEKLWILNITKRRACEESDTRRLLYVRLVKPYETVGRRFNGLLYQNIYFISPSRGFRYRSVLKSQQKLLLIVDNNWSRRH